MTRQFLIVRGIMRFFFIAKQILAVTASSISSERAFSLGGNILSKKRSRLTSVVSEQMWSHFHKQKHVLLTNFNAKRQYCQLDQC